MQVEIKVTEGSYETAQCTLRKMESHLHMANT